MTCDDSIAKGEPLGEAVPVARTPFDCALRWLGRVAVSVGRHRAGNQVSWGLRSWR